MDAVLAAERVAIVSHLVGEDDDMDGQAFDNVARALATGASRRRALRLLGGLGAAALAVAGRRSADAYPSSCTSFILSGGPDPDDQICVDDALRVRVNGVVIYRDPDNVASCVSPIAFNASTGSTLRVIARDVIANCRSLSPLYLHCATGGKSRFLHRGVPAFCVQSGWEAGVFYNRSFII